MAAATAELEDLVEQIDFLEITPDLARDAGRLAQQHGLRGYDAVHLAAGVTINGPDVVFVTGDGELAAAARAAGLATAVPSEPPA
jgi:predicted nucleic acid-binding protein